MKDSPVSGFLSDTLPEIDRVLSWFRRGADCSLTRATEEFVSTFLGAVDHDGALIPKLNMYPPELLGRVLTQHETAPDHPLAWLNLGFALRRMALLGTSDAATINARRLDQAMQCFRRSLDLESKNVRAWTGCALVEHQRGDHEREIDCYQRALAIDPSDPGLWLLYSAALEAAGRHEEALTNIDSAYHYYLLAGQPAEFQPVFEGFPNARTDLRTVH